MAERIEVATLGEALAVMDPLDRGALRHVETFAKRIGGAELNVAVALSRLGHRAGWAGRLGDDEFGREILGFLRGEGVDASGVHLDPDAPTGLYFKERRALDRLSLPFSPRTSCRACQAGGAIGKCRRDWFGTEIPFQN